ATAGQGPSTASQTAWAVLGLLAAGEGDGPEVRAGVEYLIGTQNANGGWAEEAFTGTGFPRVFYLKYHMYPVYFPLMALGKYAAAIGCRLSAISQSGYRLDTPHHTPSRKGSSSNILADS
ncbi:MAG TPA: hypothetical protein VKE74_29035, partial [Gemmataceae bacterium]|nr:hypothetical protein [Gemmataceae bacterium]